MKMNRGNWRGSIFRQAGLGFFFLILLFPSYAVAGALRDDLLRLIKSVDDAIVSLEMLPGGDKAVFLTKKALCIYDLKTAAKPSCYNFGEAERPLKARLIDIDHNGQYEVAVTSVLARRPSSYLFRIAINNDHTFEKALSELTYFLRVIKKGGNDILIGQQSSGLDPYAGSVYELVWDGTGLKKGEKVDLPRNTGIYQFALIDENEETKVWVRDDGGFLRRYEKEGKKWKETYKTAERYRGNVNCYTETVEKILAENVVEPVCVPTSPIVDRHFDVRASGMGSKSDSQKQDYGKDDSGYEMIVIDNHDFLLGGVMLKPSHSYKSYMHVLRFDELDGMKECKRFGPYRGWIGDYLKSSEFGDDSAGQKGNKKQEVVLVLKNGSDKYAAGRRVEEIDMSNIDCSGEM